MKKRMILVEIVFDVAYLVTVLWLGFLLLLSDKSAPAFGVAAFVLAGGDAFHLLPRICNGSMKAKGFGKAMTSITMAIFYVLLCPIPLMYLLAALRIFLCLLPQNKWTSSNPPYRWSLIRNLPLIFMGVTACFALGYPMWIPIGISFICYIPVVLWVHKYPLLGMLMLPKSIAYIAILVLGFTTFGSIPA